MKKLIWRQWVLALVLAQGVSIASAPKANAIVWVACLFDAACEILSPTELGDSDIHPHPPLLPGFVCQNGQAIVFLGYGQPGNVPMYQRAPSFDAFCQGR